MAFTYDNIAQVNISWEFDLLKQNSIIDFLSIHKSPNGKSIILLIQANSEWSRVKI